MIDDQDSSKLVRDQTAVWIPPDNNGRPYYHNLRDGYVHRLYCHILMEDMRNNIIPFSLEREREETFVEITNEDKEIKKIIRNSLNRRHYSNEYGGRSLVQEVRKFMGLCVAEILIVGKATYELVFHRNLEGKYVGFNLFFIEAASLAEVDGKTVQKIPQWLADKRGLPTDIVLPLDKLIVFDEPREVKGYLTSVMDLLAAASGPISPSFSTYNLEGGKPKIPYDFSVHNEMRMRLIASATRKIGWNARQTFSDFATEPYEIFRQIKFQHFLIHMREHLLKKINHAIQLAGNEIGFSTSLKFVGLPTEPDVENAYKHLSHGTASFSEILKPFGLS